MWLVKEKKMSLRRKAKREEHCPFPSVRPRKALLNAHWGKHTARTVPFRQTSFRTLCRGVALQIYFQNRGGMRLLGSKGTFMLATHYFFIKAPR
jgi:hypothetical protein